MTARRWLTVFVLTIAVWSFRPTEVRAQFDTANRSFHNGTAFRLDGRHQTVPCESCHLNGQYRGTPTTCYDCHWVRRRDDRYQTRLGTQCEQCHRPVAWSAVRWNHAAQTGVALNADHRTLACESCHRGQSFRAGSVTCAECHQRDFAATRSPNHTAAGFPMACESCHRPSETTWRNTGTGAFNHSAVFPLVGTHAMQACTACHRNNVFRGTPRDCAGCHQQDYARAQNPNHAAAGFPMACDACHRATDPAFRGSGAATTFNHNSVFALTGMHATQACSACHVNNVFHGTPRECVGCHQNNYNRTQNPNHVAAGFSTTCETCHRASDPSWTTGAGFNHNNVFALAGIHATVACAACHRGGVYRGTPRECVGCHQSEYTSTRNPPHAAAGFSTACETCHRPTDAQWAGAGFNHSTVFALVGVHATQACAACHVNNVYRGTPRECVGCHQTQYSATRTPPHAAAGFSTACDTCHRPTDPQWAGAGFNHSAVFALVGVHANQACTTCHVNGVYRGTPRECVGCHQAQYTATRNPPHAAAGFGTACDTCHRPTDAQWAGAGFNHNTVFALVGVHATQACAVCHVNGVFRGTSRTCIGCHQSQYNATRNPPHAAAGFSTACDTCHRPTDAQWTGASFNHSTVFALVGVHAARPCTACHVNNVYHGTPRTCVGCHQAQYNATRNPNHQSTGFGTSCETCHRATDASWQQGTFTHNQFPRTGHHNVACAQCHTTAGNYAVFSCTVCHTRAETDGHHRNRNGYVYDSNACYSCHPNGRAG